MKQRKKLEMKASVITKLKTLGLDDDEIDAFVGQ